MGILPKASDSVGLGQIHQIPISDKFPGDVDIAGPGPGWELLPCSTV